MRQTLSDIGRRCARFARAAWRCDWRAFGGRLGRAGWNVALAPLFVLGWAAGFAVRAVKLAWAALWIGFDAGKKI